MSKNIKPAQVKTEGENAAAVVAAPAEKKVEAPTTKAVKKEQTAKSAGFCAYIGPSIHGVIQTGHIYEGDKAKVLKELAPIVEKRPLIAALVVDGATLKTDRIKVKTPGNLLFVQYQKLAAGEIN